jgi:hypothetical protein
VVGEVGFKVDGEHFVVLKFKVTLQNGTEVMVTVQYPGEEGAIFGGNDPLVREKLNFKVELIKIL